MLDAAVRTKLTLRPAAMADADRLLEWRNDPLTRQMSVNQTPVKYADHLEWLKRRLASPDPLLIAEVAGIPVGTVRLDGDELSWTVSPHCRGRRFGSEMVARAVERFGAGLRARIKPSNGASLRIAERCGLSVELVQESV